MTMPSGRKSTMRTMHGAGADPREALLAPSPATFGDYSQLPKPDDVHGPVASHDRALYEALHKHVHGKPMEAHHHAALAVHHRAYAAHLRSIGADNAQDHEDSASAHHNEARKG